MRKALIVSILGAVMIGSGGAAAAPAPVFISPHRCPVNAGGASQDPFYDVRAIQGRQVDRGRSTALVVSGRYRATEPSGQWTLHVVRYRANSQMLDLELRRAPGPIIRNPPCVNFTGSFTNGNPKDVLITDRNGRRITVPVHQASGPSPRK